MPSPLELWLHARRIREKPLCVEALNDWGAIDVSFGEYDEDADRLNWERAAKELLKPWPEIQESTARNIYRYVMKAKAGRKSSDPRY